MKSLVKRHWNVKKWIPCMQNFRAISRPNESNSLNSLWPSVTRTVIVRGWSAAQHRALVSMGHHGGTRAHFVACLCHCGGRGTKHALLREANQDRQWRELLLWEVGPLLNAGRWSAWAIMARQEHTLLPAYAIAVAEGRSARFFGRRAS